MSTVFSVKLLRWHKQIKLLKFMNDQRLDSKRRSERELHFLVSTADVCVQHKSLSEWPSPLKLFQHELLMAMPLPTFSLFMNADLRADTAIERKTYEEEWKGWAEYTSTENQAFWFLFSRNVVKTNQPIRLWALPLMGASVTLWKSTNADRKMVRDTSSRLGWVTPHYTGWLSKGIENKSRFSGSPENSKLILNILCCGKETQMVQCGTPPAPLSQI